MNNNLGLAPTESTATLRIFAVGWAICSLFLAFLSFTNLSMLGFPDGYVTPYDSATKQILETLSWVLVAQAAYFLWRGIIGRLRPATLLLQIAAVLAFILAPIQIVDTCPQWDVCTQVYEQMTGTMMDDGAGG